MPDEKGLAASSKLAEQATAKVKLSMCMLHPQCRFLGSSWQVSHILLDLQADLSYSYWAAGQKQGTATVQEKV
jgi:hypothetical protein